MLKHQISGHKKLLEHPSSTELTAFLEGGVKFVPRSRDFLGRVLGERVRI